MRSIPTNYHIVSLSYLRAPVPRGRSPYHDCASGGKFCTTLLLCASLCEAMFMPANNWHYPQLNFARNPAACLTKTQQISLQIYQKTSLLFSPHITTKFRMWPDSNVVGAYAKFCGDLTYYIQIIISQNVLKSFDFMARILCKTSSQCYQHLTIPHY